MEKIIVVIVLIYFFFKKSKTTGMPEGNAPEGFKQVAETYGLEFARNLERMFRKETAHFTSGQWLGTGTAGMEAVKGKEQFPWGWSSLSKFAIAHGLTEDDFFIKTYTDNHVGDRRRFIGFKQTKHSVLYTAWFIQTVRNGDIVSWYRLPINDKAIAQRKKYKSEMMKIVPKFV